MKITIAQANPLIGDISGNGSKVASIIQKNQDSDLIVFPELFLWGYPAKDLIYSEDLYEEQLKAIEQIIEIIPAGMLVALGGIDILVDQEEKSKPYKVFNTLFILTKKTIFAKVYKTLLPNYDVFEEKRYFSPNVPDAAVPDSASRANLTNPTTSTNLIDWKGFSLLFTICEDIWPPNFSGFFSEYDDRYDNKSGGSGAKDNDISKLKTGLETNPILSKYKNEKVDLILNSAASPFHLGKPALRQRVAKAFCSSFSRSSFGSNPKLIYVNGVGAQDSLIFDGGGFVLEKKSILEADQSYQVTHQLPHFKEEFASVEILKQDKEIRKVNHNIPPGSNPVPGIEYGVEYNGALQYCKEEFWFRAIALGLKDFVEKNSFGKVVIGLSGGIDSALVSTIATLVLGPDKVWVIELPSKFTSEISLTDAALLRENLNLSKSMVPIQGLVEQFKSSLSQQLGQVASLTEENLQSRIRGVFLMAFTNELMAGLMAKASQANQPGVKSGVLLLNTSNKSELSVGYGTLYGDLTGGLSIIGDLFKTEVYQLAKWINKNYDGLIPERIITREPSAELKENQIDKDTLPEYEILDQILEKYLVKGVSYKSLVEQGFAASLVKSTIKKVEMAEFKRKQFPPILKLSEKSFGLGRKVPITKKLTFLH